MNCVVCVSDGAHLVSFSVCCENKAYTSISPNEKAKTILSFLFHFRLLNKEKQESLKLIERARLVLGKLMRSFYEL